MRPVDVTPSAERRIAAGCRPVLMFVPWASGGIAEYAHAQGNELARRGHRVILLAPPGFLARHPHRGYEARGVLCTGDVAIRVRFVRRARHALCTVANSYRLAAHAALLRPRFVLLDSMSELLAPLWAWPHWLLAKLGGLTYVATLHDPVRRPRGPRFWHRLSLRAGYAPLSVGLIHDLASAKKAQVPAHVRLVEVPHGIFHAATPVEPLDPRTALGIPSSAPVALAFGHVADRKNLDLAIAALAHVPALHLLVTGQPLSSAEKPLAAYRRQAEQLGVDGRCHFIGRFIEEPELAGLFGAADFLLLAYSRAFVSQSGVLHVAANWDLPVLASGGEGPMLKAVREFGLGQVIEPDSLPALVAGLQVMIDAQRPDAGWPQFREAASWSRNVDILLTAVDGA